MVAGWSSGSGSCWYWGRALAALVACCGLAAGCSPRNSAADAAGLADAQADVASDIGGDLADSGVDSATEVQDGQGAEAGDLLDTGGGDRAEVGDAITDVVVGDLPDIDVVQADIPIFDATPAVDTAVPCSATEIPAALTGTVEFEAAAYIYNPVVMGCGKGPPTSVKEGTPGCCNCAPPYSCYCNGECGWLRAPDLVKPQHDGQAVWTGKWVVSLGESYDVNGPGPSTLHVQKWQPGSAKGFEMVPLPTPWLFAGYPKAFMWGKQVVLAAELANNAKWTPGGYAPAQPVYLYEPDTNVFTKITMPFCGKLLVAGGTLVCVAKGKSVLPGEQGGLQVYDAGSGKWTLVLPPVEITGNNWASSYPADTVADYQAVYLVGAITTAGPWPDGTPGWPKAGHILKYEVNNQKWSDIGFVPVEWHAGPLMMDHIGIVRTKGAIQAARFRLDNFTWEVGPKMTYDEGGMQPVLSPCGLVFGDGTSWGGNETGGMQYRPILLANDLSWKLLSPWGYPNDAVTSRKGPNTVITDQELFALGGFDGPPEGNFVYHKDSYRYPLSALCGKGGSK